MKKLSFLLCTALVVFCTQNIFAEEGQTSDNQTAVNQTTETPASDVPAAAQEKSAAYKETEQAIKKAGRFFKNEEIAVPAMNLTAEERNALYDKYHKNTKKAALLNGLAGFGSGSFATKGYISGSCLLLAEGACWGCAGFGAWLIWGNPSDNDLGDAVGAVFGAVYLVLGGIGVIGSRAIGAGVGSANCASYNSKLKDSLGAQKKIDVSFAPVFNPFTKDAGFAVSLKL